MWPCRLSLVHIIVLDYCLLQACSLKYSLAFANFFSLCLFLGCVNGGGQIKAQDSTSKEMFRKAESIYLSVRLVNT